MIKAANCILIYTNKYAYRFAGYSSKESDTNSNPDARQWCLYRFGLLRITSVLVQTSKKVIQGGFGAKLCDLRTCSRAVAKKSWTNPKIHGCTDRLKPCLAWGDQLGLHRQQHQLQQLAELPTGPLLWGARRAISWLHADYQNVI